MRCLILKFAKCGLFQYLQITESILIFFFNEGEILKFVK